MVRQAVPLRNQEGMVIVIASPADSGLPVGTAFAQAVGLAAIPMTGIPVLVLHGPIPVRAALGVTPAGLLIRPLPPLVPTVRLRRGEITAIEVEGGHWYALGRRTVCVRRAKGPSVRLMAPPVPGVPDGTDYLGRLLRAWWRSGR